MFSRGCFIQLLVAMETISHFRQKSIKIKQSNYIRFVQTPS